MSKWLCQKRDDAVKNSYFYIIVHCLSHISDSIFWAQNYILSETPTYALKLFQVHMKFHPGSDHLAEFGPHDQCEKHSGRFWVDFGIIV